MYVLKSYMDYFICFDLKNIQKVSFLEILEYTIEVSMCLFSLFLLQVLELLSNLKKC